VIDPRLSVNPACTPDQTVAEDLALARRLGLERTTLSAAKLHDAGWSVADTRRELRGAGIVAVDSIYQPAWFDLRAPASWPALQERMIHAIEIADGLEAPLQVTTGGARGLPHEDACAACMQAFEPIVAAARRAGVALLLEPARTQFAHVTFLHTLRDAFAFVRSQRFEARLVFDVTHCWWEPGLDVLLGTSVGAIGSIHLADLCLGEPLRGRRVPGDGDLPLVDLLRPLLAGGYSGALEVEVMGPAIEAEGREAALRRSVAAASELLATI
jgi:sugar phosphate isomerase/epimerase